MMEKALWPHTICLALSYDDTTQANRDAAAMFQYQDCRLWLARLRQAVEAKLPGGRIRFLIAGEQGDRNGRCHWHCIIFSSVDLLSLGEVRGFKRGAKGIQTLVHRADILTTPKVKRRCNWSLWGHGFVTFQEPDQGGMHYVLSYVLKDQFTPEKSHGTMRECDVENFATGLFRMSKRPAIGEQWLYNKFAKLDDSGSVLPNLNMTVPGVKGFYHPSGTFRQKALWALVALNKRVLWHSGQNAPQWRSLLASCADNEFDMEVLNVQKDEAQAEYERRVNALVGDAADKALVGACASLLPCSHCLNALSGEVLAALGLFRYTDEDGVFSYGTYDTSRHVPHEQASPGKVVNPYCRKAGSEALVRAFSAVYGDKKSNPETSARGPTSG